MANSQIPIVLVQIDRNSRIEILQTDDVQVAFVDNRVDGAALTLLPRVNQMPDILASIGDRLIITPTSDLGITAYMAVAHLADRAIVVAAGPVLQGATS